MKRAGAGCTLVLLFACRLLAQNVAVPRLDVPHALATAARLAAPDMEGRRSGTAAGERAAQFIAEQFRSAGLQPSGEAGTYFQPFTFPAFDYVGPFGLALLRDGKSVGYRYGADYQVLNISGPGHETLDTAWVGYGVSSDDYDDYKGVDVHGKAVMVLEGVPSAIGKRLPARAGQVDSKAEAAIRHGARALLLVPDPLKGKQLNYDRQWGFSKERWKPNLMVARIDVNVAADIFAGTGRHLDVLKSQINAGQPAAFDLGRLVQLDFDVAVDPQRKTANVLAIIPGTDASLKQESILLGGHYDSGGPDPTGDIYPGAEDDASGVALLLEIGRALEPLRGKLKRTVILGAWAAEELGASGHFYYLKHPVLPVEKTVASFWLDNAGVGDGHFRFNAGTVHPELYDFISEHVDPTLRGLALPTYYYEPEFEELGIPFFFPHPQMPQPFNHTPWDKADLLSPEQMSAIGQYVLDATVALANAPAGVIEERRRAAATVRSTPVFTLAPVAAGLVLADAAHWLPNGRSLGPVIFFPELDLNSPSLMDNVASIRNLKDAAGHDVAVAGRSFPRSYSETSANAVAVSVDLRQLALKLNWWSTLRTLGARNLIIRGDSDALPAAVSQAGRLKDELHSVLRSSLVLASGLDAHAVATLANDTLVVVTDAASPDNVRYSASDLSVLRSPNIFLAVRFKFRADADDRALADKIAALLSDMKTRIGLDHLVIAPDSATTGGTSLAAIVDALQRRGWSFSEIRAVLGGSLQRAWSQTMSE